MAVSVQVLTQAWTCRHHHAAHGSVLLLGRQGRRMLVPPAHRSSWRGFPLRLTLQLPTAQVSGCAQAQVAERQSLPLAVPSVASSPLQPGVTRQVFCEPWLL
jgi:hypothetical protein